jgi:hypothetical protein
MTSVLGIVFSLPIFASESFVLNIPQRFDVSQETGEARIILGLDSPPTGAQLLVNGTTTVDLGATQTVAGDSVSFSVGPGNSVRIVYQPLSNFAGDFCHGAGATEKNIPMRFVGAQDVVDYRVSSYVVASPLVECSQVARRGADYSANIMLTGDGVAPALVATNKFRLPLDVMLVLDKSGSIADLPPDPPAGSTVTKAMILRSAAKAFVGHWQQLDQPTMDGADWAGDRIGVVFFDDTVSAHVLPGGDPPAGVFVPRAAGTAWNAVIGDINTLAPAGSTSIGGGINEGMKQWKADQKNDVSIILITDGMQNAAPLIAPTGSGFLGLVPVAGLDQELRRRFIPIYTIAFGLPATVDATLLTNVAFETAGRSYMSVDATTIYDTLATTLVSVLKGNTASMALRKLDTLVGTGPTQAEPVLVDKSARRVVYSVQWAPDDRDILDLEVFAPGAASPSTPTSSKKLAQASIQTFDIKPADIGTWKVRVKRNVKLARAVPYTLNAFILERDLDYRLSFDKPHGTGDTIQLRARLSYDGKPLTGLPADAIRVRILRPDKALGSILHDAKPTGRAPAQPPGDVRPAYAQKIARLGGKLLDQILPKPVATITLKEDQRGVYLGEFKGTTTPGAYAFEATLDWDDTRTGHVRRVERFEEEVKVNVDASKTDVKSTRIDARTVAISVTPRDQFGNFLGPGYASLIKATVRNGGVLAEGPPADKDQTGTYVITVKDAPKGTTPDVEITVDGVPVARPGKPR